MINRNQKLIFVVGNSRSGTTMLGRMLGRNSQVYKFPELHLFGPCIPYGEELKPLNEEEVTKAFCWLLDVADRKLHATRLPNNYINAARSLSKEHYHSFIHAWEVYYHFVLYEVKKRGKEIPSEDLPGNVFKIDQILKVFPEAVFINMIRDPRDVLLSQKNRHQRRKHGGGYVKRREMLRFWANYHPQMICRLWKNAINAGYIPPREKVFNVYFEKLIINPASTLQEICMHCGIEYQIDMLNVPQVGSSMRKDEPEKAGIDSTRTGTWNSGGLNAAEIEICEKINGDWMDSLGYSRSNLKGTFVQKVKLYLLLPIKLVLALLLNWNRTKGRLHYLLIRFFK